MRIEFKLNMPNIGSWNGQWSGSGKHYTKTIKMKKDQVKQLFGDELIKTWWYDFGDGWSMSITGRILHSGEKLKKSAGFCNYDWAIDSILKFDKIQTE